MPHTLGGTASRAIALLLLTLGLVGLHQLAAAAHSAGSTAHGSMGSVAVDHTHAHGTGDACAGDDTTGVTPSCGGIGNVCIATLDGRWVLGEPPGGSTVPVGDCRVCVQEVYRGAGEWAAPDLTRLQVSRT